VRHVGALPATHPDVVLAKARTHNPRQLLWGELVVPACVTIQSGGNGSWLSPGRQRRGREAAFPRREFARALHHSCPSSDERAQGMPDAQRTRSLVCKVESTRVRNRRFAETIRHSPRDGFAAYTCSSR